MNARYHLGLDVGSISLNTVLLKDDKEIVFEDYTRIKGQPYDASREVLGRLLEEFPAESIATVSITGTGAKLLSELLGGVFINEIIAQTRAAGEYVPQAKSIIDMGGEDSKLILVNREGDGPLTIQDFAMNTMCAAGTGSFLDQQAHRLGYGIEDFGREALRSEVPPRIAGRCSVFAKSDMIHLQQGATPDYEIIAGLCHAMIRNLKSNIAKGKKITPPLSFQGGVAANLGVRKAITDIMDLGDDEFIVPEHFFSMGAIGAALHTLDQLNAGSAEAGGFAGLDQLIHYLTHEKPEADRLEPLVKAETTPSTAYRRLDDLAPGETVEAYLGIDVGSISTNVVVIDERHERHRPGIPHDRRPAPGGHQAGPAGRGPTGRRQGQDHGGRHHRLRPVPDRRFYRRGRGAQRNHGPGHGRRGHRPPGGHHLRDRRAGLQIHQPGKRGHRGLHDEQGLRGRHRFLPRGTGGKTRGQHQGGIRQNRPVRRKPGPDGRTLHRVHGIRPGALPAAGRGPARPDGRPLLLHRASTTSTRWWKTAASGTTSSTRAPPPSTRASWPLSKR